jgi:hypothetical protein
MATVTEILAAQAKAVKNGKDKLSVADHLEAAAKLIRMEAATPKRGNFIQELRDKKQARIEKFQQSVQASFIKNLDADLKRGGWMLGRTEKETGIRHYGDPARPGCRMEVKGNKFSVFFHEEIKVDRQPVSFLDSFLKKQDYFLSIKRP